MANKYDSLKIDCLEDVAPVNASSSWTITDSRTETITITGAILPDGYFVYGYAVYWADGRTSASLPSAERGKFRTQREASLHALGFLSQFLPYFTPESRNDILHAERSLAQDHLS